MNHDEASVSMLLRIVAGLMIVIAGMGCFVVALTSGILFITVAMPFTILGIAGAVLFIGTFLPCRSWLDRAKGR